MQPTFLPRMSSIWVWGGGGFWSLRQWLIEDNRFTLEFTIHGGGCWLVSALLQTCVWLFEHNQPASQRTTTIALLLLFVARAQLLGKYVCVTQSVSQRIEKKNIIIIIPLLRKVGEWMAQKAIGNYERMSMFERLANYEKSTLTHFSSALQQRRRRLQQRRWTTQQIQENLYSFRDTHTETHMKKFASFF